MITTTLVNQCDDFIQTHLHGIELKCIIYIRLLIAPHGKAIVARVAKAAAFTSMKSWWQ
jgi:hypothetical protein